MAGLSGEYNHTMDAKGRLSIPSKFRTVLGESFHICKGMDPCLVIYTDEEWEKLQAKLDALPTLDPDAEELRRFYGSGSADVDLDPHGRIQIPGKLVKYASLVKDVTIIGTVNGKAEIWDTEMWENREGKKDPKAAAASLASKGFMI